MSDDEAFDGFGDDGGESAAGKRAPLGASGDKLSAMSDQKQKLVRTRTLDPGSKIATLGKNIRLPGMGMGSPPPGGIAMPGMGDGGKPRPKSMVGADGDEIQDMASYQASHRPEYEESWEDKEARQAEERRAERPVEEKLAKMLAASNASRGIFTGSGMGLAGLMGGKKKVPAVAMAAPYSEHLPKANQPGGGSKPPAGGIGGLAGLIAAGGGGGGGGGGKPKGFKLPGMAASTDSKPEQAEAVKTIVQKDKSGLKVIGCGSGGVEEMQSHLSEGTVQWGLLRFQIGSGTFKRNKMLMIHFNGHNCPGPARAKLNRNASKVEQAFGHIAQKLDLSETEEANLDNILELTKKTLAGDALGDFSLGDMKAEYEQMIADSRRKAIEAMIAGDSETIKRKTAKELGVKAEKALELVRKPMGAFNWALFKPDPADFKLYDAGSLGVNEMLDLLPEDDILCGLIRMGFGAGKFRRTKYISIWWAGPAVGAHAKGAALGHGKEHTMRRLNPSIGPMEGHAKDDLSLEAIIDKVRRAAVIDGDGVDGVGGAKGDAGADPFSMDAYYAALEEEVKANGAFFGEETAEVKERSFGVAHTIREVSKTGGKYTWVLVEADV